MPSQIRLFMFERSLSGYPGKRSSGLAASFPGGILCMFTSQSGTDRPGFAKMFHVKQFPNRVKNHCHTFKKRSRSVNFRSREI